MKLIDGQALADAVRVSLAAVGSGRFAIAFWGAKAAEIFGMTASHKLEVICNLEMGGTNPSEIENLLRQGATIWNLPTLHAKFLLADPSVYRGFPVYIAITKDFENPDERAEYDAGVERANLESMEATLTAISAGLSFREMHF